MIGFIGCHNGQEWNGTPQPKHSCKITENIYKILPHSGQIQSVLTTNFSILYFPLTVILLYI